MGKERAVVTPARYQTIEGQWLSTITTARYQGQVFVVCHMDDAPHNALIPKEDFLAWTVKDGKELPLFSISGIDYKDPPEKPNEEELMKAFQAQALDQ